MNGPFESLAFHLLRTTLVTSIAVLVVMWLLWALRIRSHRLHRVAWLLVLLQGWLLVPFTWQVVVDPPEPIAPEPVFVDAAEVVLPPTVLEASDYVAAPVTIATTESINPPEPLAPEPFDTLSFVTGWGLIAWLSGVATLVAMGAWRYLKLFAAGKPGELATDAEWLDEWRQVREASTLRTPVELRTTRGLGPLVCWVPWVFLVLVPRTLWASLTRADRLAILRHELAHCERGDLWKNLAVRVLAIPQWFNPLVWLAVRRFEEAGEWACDDRVAASAGSMDYAKTLLQIADQIAPLPSGAVGMASGVLTRRVERLLHYPNKEVREMRGFILPVLLVAVGLLQVLRIDRVVAEETEAPVEVIEAPNRKGPSTRKERIPAYVIEPPDVITVEITDVVHKSPRRIQPYDRLVYQFILPRPDKRVVNWTTPDSIPIDIDGQGGFSLNRDCQFNASNMRLEDARSIIEAFHKVQNPNGAGTFTLEFAPGAPQISGEHLLGPDGKVNFGHRYGKLNLNGLTIEQAKQSIEEHLSHYLVDFRVAVDIHAYNSKKYYLITKNERGGESVDTCPITGNETVMDAIATVGGLKHAAKIWVERQTGEGYEHLVMPVNYEAITKGADTSTNHLLLPRDRLFIEYADGKTGSAIPQKSRPLVGVAVNSDAGLVKETTSPVKTPSTAKPKAKTERQDKLPPYVIEPPDIISVRATKLVPRDWPQPHLQPFDGLTVRATNVDAKHPIDGEFGIDERGRIDLGLPYGQVHVAGWPTDWVERFILQHVLHDYPNASITLKPAFSAKAQQIVGEHLVGPDGRVNLGSYGSVDVNGLTIREAKQAIEKQLAKSLVDPDVTVDIFAYNSKKYYIITKNPSVGDNIVTAPATGNETVMDAIATLGGLEGEANIWVERSTGEGFDHLVKPVRYEALMKGEDTSTNHQLWPGDKLFIEYPDKTKLEGVEKVQASEPPREAKTEVDPPAADQATRNDKSSLTGLRAGNATVVVRWVTDPTKSLRNIEGLGKEEKGVDEGAAVVGDTRMVLGLLKVLEKNDVADVVVAPKITTQSMRTVHSSLEKNIWVTTVRPFDDSYGRIELLFPAGPAKGQQFHLKLNCMSTATQTVIAALYGSQKGPGGSGELPTPFALNVDQSCIVRVSELLMGTEGPDYYFVVTREE